MSCGGRAATPNTVCGYCWFLWRVPVLRVMSPTNRSGPPTDNNNHWPLVLLLMPVAAAAPAAVPPAAGAASKRLFLQLSIAVYVDYTLRNIICLVIYMPCIQIGSSKTHKSGGCVKLHLPDIDPGNTWRARLVSYQSRKYW